jgi:hypothetical protein
VADALATLQAVSRYSLEIRISLDDVDAAKNDAVRGKGAHARAVRALRLLHDRGLLRHHSDRLVDHLPGDPARERTRPRTLVSSGRRRYAGVLRTAHGPPPHWRGLSRMPGL